MNERGFTSQEIFDAVARTKVRMQGEILELHKKVHPNKSSDEISNAHDYNRGAQAVNHVMLELSTNAGFNSCTMNDTTQQKDAIGLKAESNFGNTGKVISTMVAIANSREYQDHPIARVGMEVLAEELGIKKQYLAASSLAMRNIAGKSLS